METAQTELVETGEKRDTRGRRIAKAEHRAAVIAAYERSGLTQRAFAQREGIKYYTLTHWLRNRRQPLPAVAKFAEVRVAAPREPSTLEVVLPNGIVIRGAQIEPMVALVERLRRC